MAQGFSKNFYNSKEWLVFRQMLILERGPICEECGKHLTESSDIILHHEKELTSDNINDVNITLNPDNIKIVCKKCHNKIHDRFCGNVNTNRKGIYIVYGPPMSGKTSYVLDHKTDKDIVVDMDRLFSAITLLPTYNKPDCLKYNVFDLKNMLLDNIKTRKGKWHSAWIIGGYADKWQRDKLKNDLGAELIQMNLTKEECYARLECCNDYRQQHKEEWEKYINKWFNSFTE
ncbi:HNH endonuclease [Abyssisolibacter fermentans]|uniref:HNH endonuclease n=1 Tax=Abyssisolibacter fermentans TaxID=1766203 RepID=UPI00082C7076|nr:HNH endonuclease [Abyssisolibacter fermentans]